MVVAKVVHQFSVLNALPIVEYRVVDFIFFLEMGADDVLEDRKELRKFRRSFRQRLLNFSYALADDLMVRHPASIVDLGVSTSVRVGGAFLYNGSTATLVVNLDVGNYSPELGAAQRMPIGNYVFDSGSQGSLFGQSIEMLPDGTKVYVQEVAARDYRSFRMSSLYRGVRH